ncbi:MAG: DegV family protein [Acidobacteria bacterium]|nr:DegV family protein [Acidobacteriota bacterium]
MKKTGILVDSTADFPPGLVEQYGLHLMPIHVFVEGHDYLDGISLQRNEFLEHLHKRADVKTAPPYPGEYAAMYEKLLQDYDQVISFHISSELSGCVASAGGSRQFLKQNLAERVRQIDTGSLCVTQAMLVQKAAEFLHREENLDQLETYLQRYMADSYFCFTVDNLTWLRKGGRVSALAAFMGNILNIKPVIHLENKRLIPVDRARGRQAALEMLVERAKTIKELQHSPVALWIAHVDAPADAKMMQEKVAEELNMPVEEVRLAECGPTIAAHAGPGAIAWGMLPK